MKKILFLLALLVSQSSFAKPEYFNSLNAVYDQMLSRHHNDAVYVKKIMDAKRKWQAFVKAQSDLMYFDHDGTMATMCMNGYESALEIAVANETKYLFYFEDGDACSGRG